MMIKANELRIGNWYFEYGMPRQATALFIYKLESIRIRDKIAIDISPIPLTPEILEKCGFVYDGTAHWVKRISGMNVCHFPDIETHIDGEPINYLPSLHQVQNLYFALTGEELTITL
jgi:hypothetical protein